MNFNINRLILENNKNEAKKLHFTPYILLIYKYIKGKRTLWKN